MGLDRFFFFFFSNIFFLTIYPFFPFFPFLPPLPIGMEFFFGKLAEGNPKLKHTDYDNLNYYGTNFDCFSNALITLFELMVVNNWQVFIYLFLLFSF